MLVMNKMDLVPEDIIEPLARRYDAIPVSALDPSTFPDLLDAIAQRVFAQSRAQLFDPSSTH